MEDASRKIFDKLFEEHFSQEKVALFLVKEKIKVYGIELTKRQEKQLISYFQKHGLNNFTLNLNRQQKAQLKELGDNNLLLDFKDSDLVMLQDKLYDSSARIGIETAERLSDQLFQDWKKQSKSILKKIKRERHEFVDYHNRIWGAPLDLLEALVSLSLVLGNDFCQRFSLDSQGSADIVFHVLKRLHVRGCQISSEILTLLRGGFADGAHARWRTLHEITVVAKFIANHDNELAKRYLDNSAIVDYQRALQYRKYSDDLSYMPMSDDDFSQIRSNYETVKEKYRNEFNNADWYRNDYWWASGALDNQRPNFALIEEKIGVSFMQPFVKLAHVNVHAGSTGMFIRLGAPPDDRDLLIAGASVFGVGEPGQNTAYSICNLTSTLILHKNKNLDNLGSAQTLRKFMEEVMQEFDHIMEKQVNKK